MYSLKTLGISPLCYTVTPHLQLITPSRASGTADQVRSLDNLFSLFLFDLPPQTIVPSNFRPAPHLQLFLIHRRRRSVSHRRRGAQSRHFESPETRSDSRSKSPQRKEDQKKSKEGKKEERQIDMRIDRPTENSLSVQAYHNLPTF